MTRDFEQEIIQKVSNGDIDSFEFLVKKYEKQMFIMVANLLRMSDRVEDIVQDIFLNAYQHIRKFDPDLGQFSTPVTPEHLESQFLRIKIKAFLKVIDQYSYTDF